MNNNNEIRENKVNDEKLSEDEDDVVIEDNNEDERSQLSSIKDLPKDNDENSKEEEEDKSLNPGSPFIESNSRYMYLHSILFMDLEKFQFYKKI